LTDTNERSESIICNLINNKVEQINLYVVFGAADEVLFTVTGDAQAVVHLSGIKNLKCLCY
jgi:hypothetical protein